MKKHDKHSVIFAIFLGIAMVGVISTGWYMATVATTINVKVCDINTGEPISGVTVACSGQARQTTDERGKCQFENVQGDWERNVSASKNGFDCAQYNDGRPRCWRNVAPGYGTHYLYLVEQCNTGEKKCVGDEVHQCVDGNMWVGVMNCPLGCAHGVCVLPTPSPTATPIATPLPTIIPTPTTTFVPPPSPYHTPTPTHYDIPDVPFDIPQLPGFGAAISSAGIFIAFILMRKNKEEKEDE